MPGYLSHYLFCIGTSRRLVGSKAYPILLQHKEAFCLGGEGPDIFLYYAPCHIGHKPSLGHRLHKTLTKQFLDVGINTLNSLKDQEEKEVLYAYLCGLICHYTLDSLAHPYVEAFANPERHKLTKSVCSYQHCNLETTIDTNLLFKYLNKFPSEQDYISITKPSGKERRAIAGFMTSVCNEVYGKEEGYHILREAQMYRILTLFPYTANCLRDKFRLKKPIFTAVEKLLHIPYRMSSVMSTDNLQMNLDVLNLAHKDWASPYEPKRIRRESFIDIFKSGIGTAYKRCQILYSIVFDCQLDEHCSILLDTLLEDLGNLSYNTGLKLK